MHIIRTYVHEHDVEERVHLLEGPTALFAAVLDELLVERPEHRCGEDFCLLNPPRWAWRAGPHAFVNVGAALFHLGQWIARTSEGRVVRTRRLADDDAVVDATAEQLARRRAELRAWDEMDD